MIKHKEILFLLSLAALILLSMAGTYGVIETSDARYAEIGREMFVSGDWLHPNLLDIHHYHKPPITYQITAFGYQLFGVNSFGARFFLQIAILIQMLLVYLLTLKFVPNKKVALWASAIYFTFPMVLIASRNLTTDVFLTTFVLLSIYTWVVYRKSGNFVWLYLFTFSLALGFLTKGPVVFIVPVVFILLYNRMEEAKQQWSVHHIMAWGLFLIIASSWFIYLAIDNPAFWDYFIGKQTVDRFSHNVFKRSEPFWYFMVLLPVLGMPWLLLLPYFMKKLKVKIGMQNIESILLLSILIPLIFFSISTSKRVLYILPFYPLISVMIALMFYRVDEKVSLLSLRIVSGYALLLYFILGIAPWIKGKILFPPALTMISLVLIFIWIWLYRTSFMTSKTKAVIISFITATYFLLSATALFSYSVETFKIATPVSHWIKQNHLDNREILVYNRRLPSLAFEMNRSTISLYDGSSLLDREVQFEKDEKWKKYLYNLKSTNEQERLKVFVENTSTLLISYKQDIPNTQGWLLSQYKNHKHLGKWYIYY